MDKMQSKPTLVEPPKDMFMFRVEAEHDEAEVHRWMSENWAFGFNCVTVYALVIFGGTLYMKNRPRYELRTPLIIWNACLTIFSIMGTIRVAPLFFQDIYEKGWHYSMCDNACTYAKPGSYWGYLFALSKIWELGDTVFIVLRKQQLIFLHYYHHITVLLYCWLFFPQAFATNRWFSLMNLFIHSFMYTYYTLRAMKFRLPKWVNIVLTSMQILQMIAGLTVNIYNGRMLSLGIPCATSWESVSCALIMYVSYFILFVKFFYDVYVRPKPSAKINGTKEQNGSVQLNGVHKQNGYHANGTKKTK